MRVALLRCHKLPSFVTWDIPNVDELFIDDRLLIGEFARRGIDASSVVWREEGIDWQQFDLALIRSTWDYIDDCERFLSTLAEIEASACRLFNPLPAVRWNSDKQYLRDLDTWGVPTVPTYPVSALPPAGWERLAAREGWPGAVVKPMIGAGGSNVERVSLREIARSLEGLAAEHPEQEFLIQPLIESVITEGEWSLIYFEGRLSHALLKKPAGGDFRAHGIYGGTVEAAEAHPQDVRQADRILASLPFHLLYTRLDLVRIGGQLSVMELELIEPILYFNLAQDGVRQFVDASLARVERQ